MNLYQIKDTDTPAVLIEYLSEKRAMLMCELLNKLHREHYFVVIITSENQ
jgi:hypothetical protein